MSIRDASSPDHSDEGVALQGRIRTAASISWHDLEVFRGSRFPVWVFDIDRSCVIWANQPALDVWAATSMDELLSRDLSRDMSPSVRVRLLQYQAGFLKGAHFDEMWTIFPHDVPRALLCRFRGCLLPDSRIAMLCEAQAISPNDADLLKSTQALLYTAVMVTTYSTTGECTYANPAARQAFSDLDQPWKTRFRDPGLQAVLQRVPDPEAEGRYVSEVNTNQGRRIHEVELRLSYDPIDGQRNFLISEIDVTEQELAKQQLALVANSDPLTGLYNRTYLAAHADAFMAAALSRGEVAALMVLDIDRFKFVNDTLGHVAGDALIRVIGRRLSMTLPRSALLARLGGDEFCCLMSSHSGERALVRTGHAVLRELRRPLKIEGHNFAVSASIGLGTTTEPTHAFADLLQKSDLALFDAKRAGGGTVRAFRPELAERSQRFLKVDNDLRAAMARGGLELYYQPRVSFATGRVIAAEALIRLKSGAGGLVLPGEFIPIAEATGRIAAIGRWVLRKAVQDLEALRSEGSDIGLSVNVSPKQFTDPSFLALLRQVRPRIAVGKGNIELEITENMLVDNDRRLRRVLLQISELGYKFSVDDFGTAYSNLGSLMRYPISGIKIDRTLIAHRDFRLLVTGVVTIARAFGVRIIAEGVDTETQREWLKDNYCDEYQGFLFSKPLTIVELLALLETQQPTS